MIAIRALVAESAALLRHLPRRQVFRVSCSLIPSICYGHGVAETPSFTSRFSSSSPTLNLTRDGNYDGASSSSVCPGCGIHLQNRNPNRPGFFARPSEKTPNYCSVSRLVHVSLESEFPGSLKKGLLTDPETTGVHIPAEKPVVCARCHSLRHYGRVKDPAVETLVPEFDFFHTVGRRLMSASAPSTVVIMVVDAADFDGTFPKKVATVLSKTKEKNMTAWKEGKPGNFPRLVLAVTKIDLLPSSISPTGFEHWVRRRARESGAIFLKEVHLVSAVKGWGVKNLVESVALLAGKGGHTWAVGTQNAGKSTLINAMARCVGCKEKIAHLTEAPLPGTTLGIVRVEGVLPRKAKLFDTPGLLNPTRITSRLNPDEQRLVHVSKLLKPRTYRIQDGHSVHIGGLMRLDIKELSVDSLYVTVWASPRLPLHMGKLERASDMFEHHFGRQLQPPIGAERVSELGRWAHKEYRVSGNNWNASAVDIAGSGIGWFSVALKGEAKLGVWTYEGVDVTLRDPLLPYRSHALEVSGFTSSKIVSKADKASL